MDGLRDVEGVIEAEGESDDGAGPPQVHPRAAKARGSVTLQNAAGGRADFQVAFASAMLAMQAGVDGLGKYGAQSGHLAEPELTSTASCARIFEHRRYAQRPATVDPGAQGTPVGPRELAVQLADAAVSRQYSAVYGLVGYSIQEESGPTGAQTSDPSPYTGYPLLALSTQLAQGWPMAVRLRDAAQRPSSPALPVESGTATERPPAQSCAPAIAYEYQSNGGALNSAPAGRTFKGVHTPVVETDEFV